MEKHTCSARMNQPGPWEYKENLDTWEQRGPDKCCSFCGSLSPESFLEVLTKATLDDSIMIEPSTKRYKYYIKRIGFEGECGIKFYTWHLPDEDTEQFKEMDKMYRVAIVESKKRAEKYYGKIIENIRKDAGVIE